MPATRTLSELVDDFKLECHMSAVPSHGLNSLDTIKYLLRRVQRELYVMHDWPLLEVKRDLAFSQGQRYLTLPAGLDFDFVNKMHCRYGSEWKELAYGITPDDLNFYNSDDNFQGFPILKWQSYQDGGDTQFEVWPIPSQSGTLRITARRDLKPLVNNTDVSTLDGTLIVLYAAAEWLARQKSEDGQLKLQKAQAYFTKLRARQGANKRGAFLIGSGGGDAQSGARGPRVGLNYIPPGYGNGS